MGRILALSGLLLSAAVVRADPVPGPPPYPLPTPPGAVPAVPAPPPKPPEDPALPNPSKLLHPDRAASLLPRPSAAPTLPPDSDLSALQQQTDRLRAEQKALAEARDRVGKTIPDTTSDEAAESVRLRARAAELLAKLEAKRAKEGARPAAPVAPPLPPVAPPKPETPPAPVPTVVPPVEALQLVQAQFRAGQFDAALPTLRRIDVAALNKEDRVLVRYLTAGCLRGLGQLDEAAAVYREVVGSHDDETLVESANWHLKAIDVRRNMLRELAEIRAGRSAP